MCFQFAFSEVYTVFQVLQSLLLKSAPGATKCGWLLLQSASVITKSDSYYKVKRNSNTLLATDVLIIKFIVITSQRLYNRPSCIVC